MDTRTSSLDTDIPPWILINPRAPLFRYLYPLSYVVSRRREFSHVAKGADVYPYPKFIPRILLTIFILDGIMPICGI